jgi:hypothetical protein
VGASEGRGLSVLLVTDSKGSLWAYQVPEPFAHHACHLLPLPAQLDLAVTPRAFLPTVQHVETPQGACLRSNPSNTDLMITMVTLMLTMCTLVNTQTAIDRRFPMPK